MAQVNAPLLSLDASGSIGNAIVFSKWKGRNYVRSLVKPSNPRSGGQTGMRSMMKFLSQYWTNLAAGIQSSWEDRADQTVISSFNAYVKENLRRWRNFLAPGQVDPIVEAETCDVITNETATAGERQITVSGDIANVEQNNWGVAIFRALATPVVTSWDNCIAVIPGLSNDSFSYVDSPLDPDTYYYNFRPFTEDGVLGAEETEVNAVVT